MLTANGAVTHSTTMMATLDFFSRGASYRGKNEAGLAAFNLAFAESKDYAIKALWNLRDVRGGKGERDLFRHIYALLCHNGILGKETFPSVVHYGRWDDLMFVLNGASKELSDEICGFIFDQFQKDRKTPEGESISLLAKWMPREGGARRAEWLTLIGYFAFRDNTSPSYYRRQVSALTERLKVVETRMASQRWHHIDFSIVPSRASMIYRKAFSKHCPERYVAYLESVKRGDVKINASTLNPAELVLKAREENETIDALWNALDVGDFSEVLVMSDVSGSMEDPKGIPMAVSVAMGLLSARRIRLWSSFQNLIRFTGSLSSCRTLRTLVTQLIF
jgi:hypothetical protein